MELKKVDKSFAVSPQIAPSDVAELAQQGYKTIICNRPDGEGNDQPLFQEIEEAAQASGVEAHYLPVESGKVSEEDAERFGTLLDAARKPVFAFCRTGTRSVTLWSLSRAGRMPLKRVARRPGSPLGIPSRTGQVTSTIRPSRPVMRNRSRSWNRTGTPSAVSWTSNSRCLSPDQMAASRAARLFSG